MTSLEQLRDSIPDFARDLRLNLGSVLTPQGAPGLTSRQIWGVALATAIASRHLPLVAAIETAASAELDAAGHDGARAAAAIMSMNNVYYRFVHLVGDAEYATLPARLRMNVMANPGIDKLDFELYSLAVSAVNGCGLCLESHEKLLRKHEVSREAIQSAVRIAAVIHGAAVVLEQFSGAAPIGLAA
ncbi:MAG: carboxymuconolactone decarboxylase family protein [Steroidobacteraceae bacterium]